MTVRQKVLTVALFPLVALAVGVVIFLVRREERRRLARFDQAEVEAGCDIGPEPR